MPSLLAKLSDHADDELLDMLVKSKWNIGQVAKRCGVSERTVYRYIARSQMLRREMAQARYLGYIKLSGRNRT